MIAELLVALAVAAPSDTNWGYASTGKGSWASAVAFPKAGCWRITGRASSTTLSYVVRPTTLSYVVKVVRA